MNQMPQTFTRRTVSRRTALAAAGALGMAGILSACGLSGDKVFSGEHEGIIVGSAASPNPKSSPKSTPEPSARAGFNVPRTQLSIGAREAYLGALASGAVDVIPDYSGNLLLYLDPKATANTAQEILQELPAAPRHPHHGWLPGLKSAPSTPPRRRIRTRLSLPRRPPRSTVCEALRPRLPLYESEAWRRPGVCRARLRYPGSEREVRMRPRRVCVPLGWRRRADRQGPAG